MLYPSFADVPCAGWRWPHFTPQELACRCQGRGCRGAYYHDPAFLDALETLRAETGRPLIINSAHRCAVWNTLTGGAPMSWHRKLAVDIRLQPHDRDPLIAAAVACGFTGIGAGRTFLHLDRRAVPARWTYGHEEAL